LANPRSLDRRIRLRVFRLQIVNFALDNVGIVPWHLSRSIHLMRRARLSNASRAQIHLQCLAQVE
jgi:hypothetical protein